MTREEKNKFIDDLAEQLRGSDVVYLSDISDLTVEANNKLRRACFKANVSLNVVKNTLLEKAIDKLSEEKDFTELKSLLKGPTSLMLSDTGNAPAKVIKEFRKKHEKPILKGAYIDEAVYVGDDKLEDLTNIKSKEELIGDVIMLLQSPAKNVISSLASSKNTLAGLLKTLEERAE